MNDPRLPSPPRPVRFFARLITARARGVAVAVLLFGGFFGAYLPRLENRPDVDDFIVDNDPDHRLSKDMEKIFSRDDFFMIAFQAEDLFTPAALGMIKTVSDQIEKLEDVRDVVSLTHVNDMVGSGDDFVVDRFITDIPTDPAALATLKARALANPLYVKNILSTDGRTTAIAVYVPTELGARRAPLMREIEAILAPWEARGWAFHWAGWPVTNVALVDSMDADMGKFIPISFVLVLLTTWGIFRNFRLLALAGIGVAFTVVATLGLAAFLDVPLNNASAAVIPIVLALATADLTHLFSHLNRSSLHGRDKREALRTVLEQILFPCLLTSVNTGIGFASLMWNRVSAIRDFGALAAAGMFFEFVFTFGLIAPLLLLFKPETIYRDEKHVERFLPRLIRAVHTFVLRRPGRVFAVCLGILALGAVGSRDLFVNTDLTEYFRRSHPHRRAMVFVRDHLTGINTLDISLRAGAHNTFRDPAQLRRLEAIQESVRAVPGVDTAFSVVDYFKEMNKSFHNENPARYALPETRAKVDQYLLLYGADDLDEYVTPGWDWTRIRLRLLKNGSHDSEIVIDEIRRRLRAFEDPAIETRPVGGALDLAKTAHVLVSDQIKNIVSAVGTIWLVMAIVLRSAPMALLFLVPNLFPIVLNFGLMGALGIPLNTGTSLIAAAAFGIIVDDTVHFFVRLREWRRGGTPFGVALENVTYEKNEASLSSAVILASGFAVLVVGEFMPVVHFGLLNLFVLASGMTGDMFFMKSIFAFGLRMWGGRRG
jgi:predicted RND superfamily exporter protein